VTFLNFVFEILFFFNFKNVEKIKNVKNVKSDKNKKKLKENFLYCGVTAILTLSTNILTYLLTIERNTRVLSQLAAYLGHGVQRGKVNVSLCHHPWVGGCDEKVEKRTTQTKGHFSLSRES